MKRQADDPHSVVGLIYRILDDPRRTFRAVALMAPLLGVVAEVAGAHPLFGIPMGWVGIAGSTAGFSVLGIITWVRRLIRRQDKDQG